MGVIPEDWDLDNLSSTTPINKKNGIVDGPFGSNLKTIHYKKFGIPIITSGYVTEGIFRASDYLYVDDEKFRQERRSAVNPGDIVMAKIGARCGASAILPEWHRTGILSGNALKITVDNTRHSTYYIWQLLWNLYSTGNIGHLKTVGAQPAISMANLKKFRLPIPPLPEQRAIATALSDVDALIAALDRLIAKKRAIKTATMQQLLTGKKQLPGFDGRWVKKTIGGFAPLQRGFDLPTFQLMRGKYPVVYSNGVMNNHVDYMVKGPGVVTGRSGTLGKVHYIENNFWPHNTSLWVTDFKNNQPKFVYYLYSFIGFERFGSGSGVPTLNRNDAHSFLVEVPESSEEQISVANILSDMDTEITALEARRNKTQAIKQGMMQELLTGRTRLI